MYNNKLIAVIKVNGKVLRESGDTVYIPFGSEYEISLRNMHTTTAVVKITIDGVDVLDGSSLVVRPNDNSSIEGFMKGRDVSHKFKFIEKTQEISDHRGDDISDGYIRISFKFEKPPVVSNISYSPMTYTSRCDTPPLFGDVSNPSYDVYASTMRSASIDDNMMLGKSVSQAPMDDGITVKGSDSDQSFRSVYVGSLEDIEHAIVFQLKGQTPSGIIDQPILIKTKIKCDTCGRVSGSKYKFCGNCGTSLVV